MKNNNIIYSINKLINFAFVFSSIILFTDAVTIDFHGQDGRAFHGSKVGKLFLTTHRLIFINKSDKDDLLSFSMPFVTLKDVSIFEITIFYFSINIIILTY